MSSNVKDSPFAVEVHDVSRDYGQGKGVFAVSLNLNWGEVVSIVGSNGCGKTTLLRCVAGFESLSNGSLRVGNDYLFSANGKGVDETLLDKMRGTMVGIVFQHYHLFPHLTVRENLELPLHEVSKIPRNRVLDEIKPLLLEFDLVDRLDSLPHQLSGGLRQRVAFVRCLSLRPRILLLDEATSGLDPAWAERISARIKAFAGDGGAVLNVSHQLGLVRAVSSRIVFMREGRIEWLGATSQFDTSNNEELKKFLRTA